MRVHLPHILMGIFLSLAAAMLAVSAVVLAVPHTPLDIIWTGQPQKQAELLRLGPPVVVGFVALSAVFAAAAVGWWQKHRWGYWLAVGLIAADLMGNLVQLFIGHVAEGLLGVAADAALLWWLAHGARWQFFGHSSE